MRIEEQERCVHDLEGSLQRAAMETDRKLTIQQQDYEKKMQVLMRQLADAESAAAAGDLSSTGGGGSGMVNGDTTSAEKDAK